MVSSSFEFWNNPGVLGAGAEQLMVPVEAIIDPAGRRPSLFLVPQGAMSGSIASVSSVRRVPVTVAGFRGDQVAVDGDLESGDLVVVAGQRGLLDGEEVKIQNLEAVRSSRAGAHKEEGQ